MKRATLATKIGLWVGCFALLLAACGGGGSSTSSDSLPDAEPTPTLDPALRLDNPLGTAGNPFVMAILPVTWVEDQIPVMLADLGISDDLDSSATLRGDAGLRDDLADLELALVATFGIDIRSYEVDSLQTIADITPFVYRRLTEEASRVIFDRTRLFVEIQLVENYGQALTALCQTETGIVTMAWLDGLTYVAARENTCGEAGIQIRKGENPQNPFADVVIDVSVLEATPSPDDEGASDETPSTTLINLEDYGTLRSGSPAVLMLNAGIGATNPNVLTTRAFCRIHNTDFYSWLLPSIIFTQEDIVPAQVIDQPTPADMLRAIVEEDCFGAMFSRDQLTELEDLPEFEEVRVSRTTPVLPYGVLTYPLEVEVGVRLSLNDQLLALVQDPVDGRYLRVLLGYDVLAVVEDEDFNELVAFIRNAGYDFAQMGN
jgi:hypothetical protein